MALVECYRNRNIYLVTIFIWLFEIFLLIRDWLSLFVRGILQLFFNDSILLFSFFLSHFPFVCIAPFILNIKIKMISFQIWRYRYIYICVCVTYVMFKFFLFFSFKRYADIYLFLLFFFFIGIFIPLFPIVMNLN